MALMMAVVGAMTTIACVAVARVPVQWLEGLGRWCGGCCVSCSRNSGERRGRRESTTELMNRTLLSNCDGEAGNYDDVESKTQRAGSVGSTLATPLLQGSGSEEVEKIGDECVEFKQMGACEFGDRCRFLHV